MKHLLMVAAVVLAGLGAAMGAHGQSGVSSEGTGNHREAIAQTEATTPSTPWLVKHEVGNIVYFVFQDPPRIERFDLVSESWKEAVQLDDTPTAFTADDQSLYVSFGRRTSRFDLDGLNEVHLHNTNYDADWLFVIGSAVGIYDDHELLSVDSETGDLLDSQSYYDRLRGFDPAPGLGWVFAMASDIVTFQVSNDGQMGPIVKSPSSGDYADATRCYVFPNEARVADNAGIVYATSDLTYAGSLAGPVDDMAFYGDLPIVLRNGNVFSYSTTLLRTGRYTPAVPALGIAVSGETVFAFAPGTSSQPEVEAFPVDSLTPQTPGAPADPVGEQFNPDAVLSGPDGDILLLDAGTLTVHRWSRAANRYEASIPLLAVPSYVAYSDINRALYVAYASGEITRIQFSELGQPGVEQPFVNQPAEPRGLATAGEYLFVCDRSGAWATHFTYSPDGALISQVDWNYYSREYTWSEANRRMYFFRDAMSPNDLLFEEILADGTLGTEDDSPYHGELQAVLPIRVSSDGALVLLGSGRIYDGGSLEQVNTLSNNISDAVWQGNALVTMRPLNAATQLQEWDAVANYSVEATKALAGEPVRLLYDSLDGMVAVTLRDGKPSFTRWNLDLTGKGLAVAWTDGTESAPAGGSIQYKLSIENISEETLSGVWTLTQLDSHLENASWSCAGNNGATCTARGTGDVDDSASLPPHGVVNYTVDATINRATTELLNSRVEVRKPSGRTWVDADLTQVDPPAGYRRRTRRRAVPVTVPPR
ncbi:MAG: hypothetical protein LJE95_12350 [Acidobacteria bacterium]|nr:hypothetical protein [Acidobacteriota bacterium]